MEPGDLFEGVVDAVGERPAVVAGSTLPTFSELDERASRLAHVPPRPTSSAPETTVAVALRNGNEYLEAMLAAFKVRAIPINVNTRYTVDELAYLIADAEPRLILHEADRADRIGAARRCPHRLPRPRRRLRAGPDGQRSRSPRGRAER